MEVEQSQSHNGMLLAKGKICIFSTTFFKESSNEFKEFNGRISRT